MSRLSLLALSMMLAVSAARADIARPLPVPGGWPQWAVVAVTFILFIGLIILISRFFRGGAKKGGDSDDGGGIFGS